MRGVTGIQPAASGFRARETVLQREEIAGVGPLGG